VGPAIDEAWALDGPAVIDFQVEREANVFPMVSQGSTIGEMLEAEPDATQPAA
jgi:acetolactate synthase-1/2/3 large subunit